MIRESADRVAEGHIIVLIDGHLRDAPDPEDALTDPDRATLHFTVLISTATPLEACSHSGLPAHSGRTGRERIVKAGFRSPAHS